MYLLSLYILSPGVVPLLVHLLPECPKSPGDITLVKKGVKGVANCTQKEQKLFCKFVKILRLKLVYCLTSDNLVLCV